MSSKYEVQLDKSTRDMLRAGYKRNNTLITYFKNHWYLYTMLIPIIVYLAIFSYYPMLGIQIAFKDWKMLKGQWGSPWATNSVTGELDLLKHFKTLFEDKLVWGKFMNTLRISSLRILCGFPVPIIITILLNELTGETFKKVVQTVSYLPHFISWVIIAGILTSLTESNGGLQNFLKAIFGHEIYFYADGNLFLVMLIVSDIWKEAGWGTIIYCAAISSISPELYEAAIVDGANRWQRIRYITLPGIVPAISINLIFSVSGIVYGGFDQIYNMYNAAVYDKADILETYLFRNGIVDGKYDIATALGLFNSVIAFILTLTANYVVKLIGGDGIW